MTIALRREIPTRLLEACYREAVALFEPLGLGYRVLPYPLMDAGGISGARQINIVNVPPDYEIGVGGVSDTEYTIEFCFFFPRSIVQFAPGANSYLDEITLLRRWLFAGGTKPNQNGRLADPDDESQTINTSITKFTWLRPQVSRNDAAIEVPVHVTFSTRETAAGDRA